MNASDEEICREIEWSVAKLEAQEQNLLRKREEAIERDRQTERDRERANLRTIPNRLSLNRFGSFQT